MQRKCLGCQNIIETGWAKYCSENCGARVRLNIKRNRPLDYQKWPARSPYCAKCGLIIIGRTLRARYCSRKCSLDAHHENEFETRQKRIQKENVFSIDNVSSCRNPQCFNAAIRVQHRGFCSIKCGIFWRENKDWLGEGPSCRVYFYSCPDCQKPLMINHKIGGYFKVCEWCQRVRKSAVNARKNHKRRAAGPSVLSVHEIAKRDGTRCHICRRKVEMKLSGISKYGPTIEHILPVSLGGTNDPENLALAHRHCNILRSNEGHSQMMLTA